MSKETDQKWVFATLYQGEYYPERVIDLNELDDLEYRDVEQEEYQVWGWPSGDIYLIVSDRQLKDEDAYSVTHDKKGVVWIPVLKKVSNNRQKVENAIDQLSA